MSRRMLMLILKNCNSKFNCFNSFCGINPLLSISLPNVNVIQRLSSPAISANIQVSKHLQPFINQPIDVILSQVDGENTYGAESVSLLKALRMHTLFKGADSKSFRDDARFKVLCEVFEKNCDTLNSSHLISGLRSLLEIGMPPTSACVMAAENSILRSIYKFNAFNLIGCLYYHHKFTETDLQKKVVLELREAIQKKVCEISTSSEVLMLVHIYYLFKSEHQKILDQKIIELLPLLDVQEICKLLCLLSEKSIRNVFILNALAFHLRQRKDKPGLKETIDVFYVFKKLNFYDPKLFSHLLNHLESEIPAIQQASLISGLINICGHLRWRHTGILDACGEWIQRNFDLCRTREFTSYILTSAALNYCTEKTKAIVEFVLPHLSLETVKSPDVLLDITWSLAILDCVPKELLLNVLSSEFYRSLVVGAGSQTSASNILKLLNLKGILRMKYPECVFRCNLYLESIKLPESLIIENCRQHIVKVLSNFVPREKCLCTNQVSDTGIFIDAELIMDKNLKPLSLLEYGVLSKPASLSKTLPIGSKRIALISLFHNDVTHYTYSLTGVNALSTRLLSDAGYTVVTILYEEYSKNKTEVQKAKYLLERIRHCIKKDFHFLEI